MWRLYGCGICGVWYVWTVSLVDWFAWVYWRGDLVDCVVGGLVCVGWFGAEDMELVALVSAESKSV